jgi:beta-aspartyl-peptidase (threonine type)
MKLTGLSKRLIVGALALVGSFAPKPASAKGPFVIAVHGGANTLSGVRLTAPHQARCKKKLAQALRAGHAVLKKGGSALDAVAAAVVVLEDSPLFNAGKGAVFSAEGKNELDASLMDGRTRNAGAVSGLTRIKNPIRLARAVLDHSPHVLLVGRGAEKFARKMKMRFVSPRYFFTKWRWKQLQRAKRRNKFGWNTKRGRAIYVGSSWGTVGAVALDANGNLAAATSTGGRVNKAWGRVGDSPIIGAGTYADNRTCAVSATGQGEYFMRAVTAYNVSARMRFGKQSLSAASHATIFDDVGKLGGLGGVIAVDRSGNIAMPFNYPAMYRGYIDRHGKLVVAIMKKK